MAYEKLGFVDNVTPLDAAHFNHMEDGIANPDWNQMQNRPFGESSSDTLTWDGVTTGLNNIANMLFRVTDNAAIPDGDMTNAYITLSTGETLPFLEMQTLTEGTYYVLIFGVSEDMQLPVYFITKRMADENLEAGVYLASEGGAYVNSLVIPGFNFYTNVKKVDAKYIPGTVVLYADTDGYLYETADTSDTTKRLSNLQMQEIYLAGTKVAIKSNIASAGELYADVVSYGSVEGAGAYYTYVISSGEISSEVYYSSEYTPT